jgi:Peptidase A4 family
MKTKFADGLCAAVLGVVFASPPVAAQTAQPLEGLIHGPNHAYRNADGSFMRGLRNQVMSQNWSGYAVTASAPYESASATWQVPRVTYDGGATPYGYEYAASWVGIGGFSDGTLVQLGVSGQVSTSNVASYNAWYELIPAGGTNIPHPVNPGDIITASLECTASCSPSSVQTWQLSMTDQTTGWTWTQSFQYQSSMASAEWIMEAPFWSGGELPLADFAEATFDPVAANGLNPNLSLSANGIVMQDPSGETSNPAAPVTGDTFSTCWGYGSLTSCTTGSFTTPPPAPTASLSASPTKISLGQSSTLTWSSANTTTCASGGFTASGTSGSAVVSPAVTTSYSVTCTGNGGSSTAMATVTVGSTGTCHAKKCR